MDKKAAERERERIPLHGGPGIGCNIYAIIQDRQQKAAAGTERLQQSKERGERIVKRGSK
jgi:hypothetical protein